MGRVSEIVEQVWFFGFKVFCELYHPRTGLFKRVRSFVRRLFPYKQRRVPAGQSVTIPKKIWIFWAQGFDAAPALVQVCIQSWSRANPGWEVTVLNAEDIPRYTEFSYSLEGKRLTYTNYANLLRLSLLKEHGGVWVDATTFTVRPLDTWLPPLLTNGFFVFEKPKTTVADWIVASTAHHPLVEAWSEYEYRYWKYAKEEWRYFWPHYLFEYLIFLRPTMRGLWNKTPRVNSHAQYVVQHGLKKNPDAEKEFTELLLDESTFLHKLDWRMTVSNDMLSKLRAKMSEKVSAVW